jgi:hypothetical protein
VTVLKFCFFEGAPIIPQDVMHFLLLLLLQSNHQVTAILHARLLHEVVDVLPGLAAQDHHVVLPQHCLGTDDREGGRTELLGEGEGGVEIHGLVRFGHLQVAALHLQDLYEEHECVALLALVDETVHFGAESVVTDLVDGGGDGLIAEAHQVTGLCVSKDDFDGDLHGALVDGCLS